MGERDEKRCKEGGSYNDDNGSDYLLEAMTGIDNEIKEKQNKLRELLVVESRLTMMPQKSVSPVSCTKRSI